MDMQSKQLLSQPVRLLEAEFEKRRKKNPSYSLRAFARSLSISHTVLSLVLSKKRFLSKRAALTISERLGFDPADEKIFMGAVTADRGTRLAQKEGGNSCSDQMDLDRFEMISSWVPYAILSLLENPNTELTPKWVAKRLGISVIEARSKIELLLRNRFIEQIPGTVKGRTPKFRPSGNPIVIENTRSTAATRRYHQELIQKSFESLENDPFDRRDLSATTLAMDPELVPFAREQIRSFRRRLTKKLEEMSTPSKKEAYQLSVQIFPLSKVSRLNKDQERKK